RPVHLFGVARAHLVGRDGIDENDHVKSENVRKLLETLANPCRAAPQPQLRKTRNRLAEPNRNMQDIATFPSCSR
ncbi:hypothetical protein, partial [Bradyrhizobium sp. JYMT SZCCT0180]|uniref:hypothetical protein n=1 Tax=Bradyrhizobium sp. JYMT SZCCT0180 TaxID=2807666 RepID=UPI001BAD8967